MKFTFPAPPYYMLNMSTVTGKIFLGNNVVSV